MDGIVPIAVYLVSGLVALSLLTMLVFGAKGLVDGKVKPLSMAAVVLPVILFAALGFAFDDWSLAAIWSLLIMLVITCFSLLLSGLRGLIGF